MRLERFVLTLAATSTILLTTHFEALSSLSPVQAAEVEAAKERAEDSARLTEFIDRAPELSTMVFGPSVTVHKFKPLWSVSDSLELPDGTLYLSVEPPLPPNWTAGDVPQQVGILHSGVFSRIKLPVHPMAIGLIGTLGGRPVITAGSERFSLADNQVRRLADSQALDVSENNTNFKLHDGSNCLGGPLGSTSALITDHRGGGQGLVTKAALQRAFGWPIHVDALDMTCATFDGEDYLDVDGFLIFKLYQGKPRLVARARIWASGAHHLLMTSESLPSNPHPSYYLEATAP